MHASIDLRGNIPCFLAVSPAQMRDAEMIDHLVFKPGAFYVMDRAYNDYARLHRMDQSEAWLVVRAKNNLKTTPRRSWPVDRRHGLRCDQTVALRDRRTFGK